MKIGSAKTQLDSSKSVLKQGFGFIGRRLGRHQPKPIAVVGRDGLKVGPQIGCKRQPGGLRERVPCSRINR